MLDINIEMRKGIMFVRVSGTLDNNTVEKWNDDVKSLIVDNGIRNIVLNVSNLHKIDIKGINSFLFSYEYCRMHHGETYMCGLTQYLRDKLKRSRLLKYVTEVSDELEALKTMKL